MLSVTLGGDQRDITHHSSTHHLHPALLPTSPALSRPAPAPAPAQLTPIQHVATRPLSSSADVSQ